MKTFGSMTANRGFTMIEAIVSIVIAGIVAGMVAVFIRTPVEGYIDAQRRSELSDVADTAVRRMARDIRAALPNSVRMSGDNSGLCLEFIPTKIGARYRAVVDGAGSGNVLDFTTTDDSFDMLWPNAALPADGQIAAGDVVVVYNDGSTNGNAYAGVNAIQVAAVATPGGTANSTALTFVAAGAAAPFGRKQLPSESPGGSFQVIPAGTHVVSYFCNGNRLTRHTRVLAGAWNLPANCAAMTAAPAVMSVLANNLNPAYCSLVYEQPGASTGLSRFGIVSMTIGITASGESVNLYHQVHVENTP
jgi:MSHA biogenesis protein MshO